jgi:hypothetical protein
MAILQPGATVFADMTLIKGIQHAADEPTKQVIYSLARRVAAVKPHQDRLRDWCDRADRLYYAEDITQGGADLWATDPSAKIPGRSHVSVNLPPVYVDVPASLQAVEPIENMRATDTTEEARTAAAALERVYTAWKQDEDFDLKFHKAVTVKASTGSRPGASTGTPRRTRCAWLSWSSPGTCTSASRPTSTRTWSGRLTSPATSPTRSLRRSALTSASSSRRTAPTSPSCSRRRTGTRPRAASGWRWATPASRCGTTGTASPSGRGVVFQRMDTYNVVIAGNMVIRGPIKYAEYEGNLPYLPLYNTFVPGLPGGRSDLYDVEQLIREKMERITSGVADDRERRGWRLLAVDRR